MSLRHFMHVLGGPPAALATIAFAIPFAALLIAALAVLP